MSDKPVVHIGENSPEEVALKLFAAVSYAEGKKAWPVQSSGDAQATKDYILDTYAECLKAVRGQRGKAVTSEPLR